MMSNGYILQAQRVFQKLYYPPSAFKMSLKIIVILKTQFQNLELIVKNLLRENL